jgi:hypothetical protein
VNCHKARPSPNPCSGQRLARASSLIGRLVTQSVRARMCGENDCRHLAAEVPQGEVYSHFIPLRTITLDICCIHLLKSSPLREEKTCSCSADQQQCRLCAIASANLKFSQLTKAPKSTAIPFANHRLTNNPAKAEQT